ncbi:hypothetical protein [Pseudomonas sp. BN414]|nr:hypothetical protein [Pseudomonas sp. BN414]
MNTVQSDLMVKGATAFLALVHFLAQKIELSLQALRQQRPYLDFQRVGFH